MKSSACLPVPLLLITLVFVVCTCDLQHHELKDQPTDYYLQATSFYQEFVDNKEISSLKYQGKVLEIVGTIQAIQKSGEGHYQIVLNSNHRQGWIRCDCRDFPSTSLTQLAVGQIIHVKGTFADFTKDLRLSPCLII